jgi:hypothetical protein
MLRMGEIVIEIPHKKIRRYRLKDRRVIANILSDLDSSAKRVENGDTQLSNEELEELADIAASTKALREIVKTGKVYTWEAVKGELGI